MEQIAISVKYINMGELLTMVTMEVELSTETSQKIHEVSELTGISQTQLVDRALLLYLDNLEKYLELIKEFRQWDALSDEALRTFEKAL